MLAKLGLRCLGGGRTPSAPRCVGLAPGGCPAGPAGPAGPDPVAVRVGILSTASIARANCAAISKVTGLVVVCVGSRDLKKAEAFAREQGIARAYGSYDEVLRDAQVDAVYVPLPTSLHKEWVLRCAAAGKHVLCEKPTALSAEELREMLSALAARGLCWLDATWFMHHDRLGAIRAERAGGLFGPLGFCHASSSATFSGDATFFETNIRVDPKLDALGCLGDLGWYCVRVALFAFDWEPPQWASALLHVSKNGVPVDLSGTLTWRARPAADVDSLPLVRTSSFHCSFLRAGQSAVTLQGRSGALLMDDFITPRSADTAKWTVLAADGTAAVHETGTKCCECANMWACFRDSLLAVRAGQRPAAFWSDISMLTQLVIDALLQSSRLGGAQVAVAKLA